MSHRNRRAAPVALVIALLALCSACDDARCTPIERCDIRAAACQKAALRHAVCLRGRDERTDFKLEVVTLSREEYLARSEADAEAYDTPERRRMRRALALLGMSPKESTPAEEARARGTWVAAHYNSLDKRVTIVDDGRPLDSGYHTTLLVHEMVHALQDRAGELLWNQPTLDQAQAYGALVEGEATLHTDEARVEGNGYSFKDIPYGESLGNYRTSQLLAARRADDLFSELGGRFRYAQGASYLWPLRKEQGAAALAETYLAPPVSSYAVMEGDPTKPEQHLNTLGDSAVPVLPELALVGSLHLGRFTYEVVNGHMRGPYYTRGEHFRADTLSAFVAPEDNVLVSWRIRLRDAVEATGLAERLANWREQARIETDGKDVWLLLAETPALLEALPEPLTWAAAPERDFGYELEEEAEARTVFCLMP